MHLLYNFTFDKFECDMYNTPIEHICQILYSFVLMIDVGISIILPHLNLTTTLSTASSKPGISTTLSPTAVTLVARMSIWGVLKPLFFYLCFIKIDSQYGIFVVDAYYFFTFQSLVNSCISGLLEWFFFMCFFNLLSNGLFFYISKDRFMNFRHSCIGCIFSCFKFDFCGIL